MGTSRPCLRTLTAALAAAALATCSGSPALPIGPTGGAETPAPGGIVRDYTLTAQAITLELKPGLNVQAWTFNGTSPGPELVSRAGDLSVSGSAIGWRWRPPFTGTA